MSDPLREKLDVILREWTANAPAMRAAMCELLAEAQLEAYAAGRGMLSLPHGRNTIRARWGLAPEAKDEERDA